ncbi:MAG: acylphosphatase [Thermodesulfobacteriota bacterium]
MTRERVRIIVHGRVQGVFYRAQTVDIATDLNLKGWVKNRDDGKVEVVAEGERLDLERLTEWCGKGPKHALVTKTEIFWEAFTGEFNNFTIKY